MFCGNQSMRVSSYLGKVPATDGGSPIGHVDAIRVAQEPVVLFDQEGSRILAYRAIHIVENSGLIPIHVHLIEPGTCFSKEHSRCDLKAQISVNDVNSGYTLVRTEKKWMKIMAKEII